MTTMEIVFIIGILIWLFVGFLGCMNCKKNRVNYEMIIFISLFLLIPLFAKVCGLL